MGGLSSSRALLIGQIRLFITSSLGVQNQNKCDPTNRRSLSRESSLADIVEGIPPTFAQRPQTKSAEVGTSAELECRFVAIPEAEVQWFHNKNLLPPNDARVSIMHQVRQIL